MDKTELLNLLEKAREKYRPDIVKTVFIAEAPPSEDRFFYFEDVKDCDYLFKGIIGILYPELMFKYEITRRQRLKEEMLRKFQNNGYYLLDLYDLPKTLVKQDTSQAICKLKRKLNEICTKDTTVILIKVTVYDLIYNELKSYFNVIDKRIPFPNYGHQDKFTDDLKKILESINAF